MTIQRQDVVADASHGSHNASGGARELAATRDISREEVGEEVKQSVHGLMAFWKKINNDWIFNLSGMLAYNLLMSIFPILLVLLAVAGFILSAIFGADPKALESAISKVLPSGAGATVVSVALANLARSSGLLLVIGLVGAAYAGSRLFVVIENCFSVLFRLRPRGALRQNIMAFGMLLLYIALIPIIFLASSITQTIAGALNLLGRSPATGFLIQAAGLGAAFLAALILFAAIYIVVPNRPVHLKEIWRGTLTGGALLVLYELIFPLYQRFLLKPDNYGSTAGFAIVILVFFYYFAFILLLGAEVNSWAAGQRETAADIPSIIHEVQSHDTTRGAAGPTAGTRREDIQHHKGAAAMRTDRRAITHERDDHRGDAQPPRHAEAEPAPPRKATMEAERAAADGRSRGKKSAPTEAPEEQRHPARKRHGAGGARVIPAIVTAALPIAMWLFGRSRTPRPA